VSVMRRILTIIAGASAAAAVAAAVTAEPPTWINAHSGVWFAGRLGAPGCAPALYGLDQARKISLLRAGAILAAARHGVGVSGRERLDGSHYSETITETAEGVLRPLEIIEEAQVVIDGELLLCVLAAEESS